MLDYLPIPYQLSVACVPQTLFQGLTQVYWSVWRGSHSGQTFNWTRQMCPKWWRQ